VKLADDVALGKQNKNCNNFFKTKVTRQPDATTKDTVCQSSFTTFREYSGTIKYRSTDKDIWLLKEEPVLDCLLPSASSSWWRGLRAKRLQDSALAIQVEEKRSRQELIPCPTNWPVANLPFLSKVLEKAVAVQLTDSLRVHRTSDYQKGLFNWNNWNQTLVVYWTREMESFWCYSAWVLHRKFILYAMQCVMRVISASASLLQE
jgi:hypothetical protein